MNHMIKSSVFLCSDVTVIIHEVIKNVIDFEDRFSVECSSSFCYVEYASVIKQSGGPYILSLFVGAAVAMLTSSSYADTSLAYCLLHEY